MEKKGLYDGVRRAPLTKEDKFGSVYLGDMGLSGDTGDVEEGFTSVIEENRNDDLKLMVDVLFALLIMVVWAVAMLLIAYSDFTEEHSLEQLLSYFIATLIAAVSSSNWSQ